MKFLMVLPARGGSKGVPNKNVMDICGRPIFTYVLDDIHACKYANDIVTVCSTNDNGIAGRFAAYDVPIVWRPENLATDEAAYLPVLWHALFACEARFNVRYDAVLSAYPSTPVRGRKWFDHLIGTWLRRPDVSAIYPVRRAGQCRPEWLVGLDEEGILDYRVDDKAALRQKCEEACYLSGGVGMLIPRRNFDDYPDPSPPGDAHAGFGQRRLGLPFDGRWTGEIDEPEDIAWAEMLIQARRLGCR